MTNLCWLTLLLCQEQAPPIKNPYFETSKWRVWRLDETPVKNVRSLVKEKGKEVPVEVTIAPIPPKERSYPVDEGGRGAIVYRPSVAPSKKYAGMWDDVYASWSRLHGYLWFGWKGSDGSSVAVKSQVMHFADLPREKELARCGINFVHRSTTIVTSTGTSFPFCLTSDRTFSTGVSSSRQTRHFGVSK